MAVYTEVGDEALAAFLLEYDLGRVVADFVTAGRQADRP